MLGIWSVGLTTHEVGQSEHSKPWDWRTPAFIPLDPAFEKDFRKYWKEHSHSQYNILKARSEKVVDARKTIYDWGVVNDSIHFPSKDFVRSFNLEEAIELRKRGLAELSIHRFQEDIGE